MEGKDESEENRNTVGESRLGDGWSLNPTSTICKGAKNCTPSPIGVDTNKSIVVCENFTSLVFKDGNGDISYIE